MAYINHRLRRKNSSGTYDILHMESNTDLVLRFDEDGSSKTLESVLETLEADIAGKLDPVASPTNGNLVSMDASGKLANSGKKATDFAAATHGHGLGDITGGTASRVIVTTSAGALTTSAITTTKLGYLTDVTSNIQAQINSKAAGDHNHDGVYSPVGHNHDSDYAAAGHNHDSAYAAAGHNHDTKYVKIAQIGAASGVAPLGTDSKVPAAYLPSYVDDVIEGKKADFPTTGESGKIYVDSDTNKTYRWSGTNYVEISASLALGETSSTAYRGDRGKIAYDHSQVAHARADATLTSKSTTNGNVLINGQETVVYTHPSHTAKAAGLYKVTINKLGHVTAATAVTKDDIVALGIPAQDTVYTHPGYTAKSSGFYKVTVDATGHVSAVVAVGAADVKGLSGIVMTGATASAAGALGMVPAPAKGDQAKFLRGDGTWQTVSGSDTKNTAGSTNSSSKLYLIGATSQAANPQTYSHDTAYVGTDGYLYSNGNRLLDISFASSQPTNQVTNDLWFEAIN